ncbi:MAG: HigA family addiction module antidote protein [Chloroflexi bacterium]|nr:HigA family addiction module antidote protein [Chloroflexota bacterium]
MQMYNPPHPGEILKELCLEPLGLTITQATEALDVSRKTLSAILNGRAGISPEMAIRLSLAFDTSAESWLNQQAQYDLWQARQNSRYSRSKTSSLFSEANISANHVRPSPPETAVFLPPYPSNGFNTPTPNPRKSATLRVTT